MDQRGLPWLQPGLVGISSRGRERPLLTSKESFNLPPALARRVKLLIRPVLFTCSPGFVALSVCPGDS